MENLKKAPPKSILKQSSSFDAAAASVPPTSSTPRASITSLGDVVKIEEEEGNCSPGGTRKKSTKFDEMNILATLHPADKDYGHMKINEPKTPFNYYEEGEEEGVVVKQADLLDPSVLMEKIKEKGLQPPSFLLDPQGDQNGEEDEEEDEELDEDSKKQKNQFESKRKAHYNEYFAVKLARQLMEKDEEEDEEDEGSGKFIPQEEVTN